MPKKHLPHLASIILFALLTGCGDEEAPFTPSDWPTLKVQCEETAGTWEDVDGCPSSCWPPAATRETCADDYAQMCNYACGEEPNCACPSDTPFWEEGVGCVGDEACPD